MALVNCPECGHSVSRQAAACPSCGHPLAAQRLPSGEQGTPPRAPHALQSPHLWGRVAMVLGAWLVTPWIVRLIFAIGVLVLAYFMFTGR